LILSLFFFVLINASGDLTSDSGDLISDFFVLISDFDDLIVTAARLAGRPGIPGGSTACLCSQAACPAKPPWDTVVSSEHTFRTPGETNIIL